MSDGELQGSSSECSLHRTILTRAEFQNAILKNAHFNGADLTNANFANADLTRCVFRRTFVISAGGSQSISDDPTFNTILSGANFRGAEMGEADIRYANFSDAVGLTKPQVDSAFINEVTKLPEHFSTGQVG